jgi:hypothetical protein
LNSVVVFIYKLAVLMRRETGPIHNATRLFSILSAFTLPLIPSETFSADIMRFDDLTKNYALAVAAFHKRPGAPEQTGFLGI